MKGRCGSKGMKVAGMCWGGLIVWGFKFWRNLELF